jgi:hypothetical protein
MNATQLAATLDLLHLHAESAAEAIDEYAAKIHEPTRYQWRWRAEDLRKDARKLDCLIQQLRGSGKGKTE